MWRTLLGAQNKLKSRRVKTQGWMKPVQEMASEKSASKKGLPEAALPMHPATFGSRPQGWDEVRGPIRAIHMTTKRIEWEWQATFIFPQTCLWHLGFLLHYGKRAFPKCRPKVPESSGESFVRAIKMCNAQCPMPNASCLMPLVR